MQPRPHIQNSKATFIRGLRALEGIQDSFYIVNCPKSVPRICVEVALDTAHLKMERAYQPRLIPLSDLYVEDNLNKTADALGLDLDDFWAWRRMAATWNNHELALPSGSETGSSLTLPNNIVPALPYVFVVDGSCIFLPCLGDGLRMLDVRNPGDPVRLGSYKPHEFSSDEAARVGAGRLPTHFPSPPHSSSTRKNAVVRPGC